jgi:hypothetical protein
MATTDLAMNFPRLVREFDTLIAYVSDEVDLQHTINPFALLDSTAVHLTNPAAALSSSPSKQASSTAIMESKRQTKPNYPITPKSIACLRVLINCAYLLHSLIQMGLWRLVLETMVVANNMLFGRMAATMGVTRTVLKQKLAAAGSLSSSGTGSSGADILSGSKLNEDSEKALSGILVCMKMFFEDATRYFDDLALCRLTASLCRLNSELAGLDASLLPDCDGNGIVDEPDESLKEEKVLVIKPSENKAVTISEVNMERRLELANDSAGDISLQMRKDAAELPSPVMNKGSMSTRPSSAIVEAKKIQDERSFLLDCLRDVITANLSRLLFAYSAVSFNDMVQDTVTRDAARLQKAWDGGMNHLVAVSTYFTVSNMPVLKTQACEITSDIISTVVSAIVDIFRSGTQRNDGTTSSLVLDEYLQVKVIPCLGNVMSELIYP